MRQRMLILALCSAAGLATLAACGGGSKHSATSTSTTVRTAAATNATPSTPEATPRTPVVVVGTPDVPNPDFTRQAIDVPAPAGAPQGTLTQVQEGDSGQYDRIVFQFQSGVPGYHIDYVASPATGCASGQSVQVSGQALLQVRMAPALAHDEAGTPTVQDRSLTTNLPALRGLVQTCDFEGVVTWVLGLPQQVDFRAFTIAGAFLVIDVKHP